MRRYLMTILFSFFSGIIFAQDVHFSQFYEAPLLRNPALAGVFDGDFRLQGVYRDQWNNITNAYRTGSFNGEYKMPIGKGNDFMTLALQALFDKAGTAGLTQTHLLPAFNYHKSLSDERTLFLSLGMSGGLIHKRIDLSRITTDEQWGGGAFDPSLPTGEFGLYPNFNQWDANVGMSLNGAWGKDEANRYFVGVAYHHLNRPKNSFYRNASIELAPKYVVSAGLNLEMNYESSFIFQADYSMQGPFKQILIGGTYVHTLDAYNDQPEFKLAGGLYFRSDDAIIPVIQVYKNPIKISLSYDVNISSLKTVSQGRGGVELSLVYTGWIDRLARAGSVILCPKF